MWVPCGRSAGLIMNKASSVFGRIAVAPESACLRSRRIIWRRGDPDGCAAPYDAPPPAPPDAGTGGVSGPMNERRHWDSAPERRDRQDRVWGGTVRDRTGW